MAVRRARDSARGGDQEVEAVGEGPGGGFVDEDGRGVDMLVVVVVVTW